MIYKVVHPCHRFLIFDLLDFGGEVERVLKMARSVNQ